VHIQRIMAQRRHHSAIVNTKRSEGCFSKIGRPQAASHTLPAGAKPGPAFEAKCERPPPRHAPHDLADEMTGIQALERIAPGLPMLAGKAERREF
jgi:hypothetical protein